MFSLLHSARPCKRVESEVGGFFFYLTLSAYKWCAVFTGNLWLDPLSIPTVKELWWPDCGFSISSAAPRPPPRSLTVIKQGIIELEREDICLKRGVSDRLGDSPIIQRLGLRHCWEGERLSLNSVPTLAGPAVRGCDKHTTREKLS